jgi:hypothetical protein
MRHLKVIGIALVAVFALIAFAGATTASATRLCATNTTPCGSVYTHTDFRADLQSGASSTFTTSGSPIGINPTIVCSGGTLGLTNTGAGGGDGVAVPVRMTALSYSGCSSTNPAGCESTWTTGPLTGATGQVTSTSGMNGTLALQLPPVTFSCPLLGATETCTFGEVGTFDATLTGGSPAIIDVVNQQLTTTPTFGCPTALNWNARFTVTGHPLYVTSS